MIYKIVNEWFSGRIELLNSMLGENDRLKESDVNFDPGVQPANLKDNSYIIRISEAVINDDESGEVSLNISVHFNFRLYKRSMQSYTRLTDEKLFALCMILKDDIRSGLEYADGNYLIASLHDLKVTGLDKTLKSGEYLQPVLEFVLKVFYEQQ